jgi:DNA modification methylase
MKKEIIGTATLYEGDCFRILPRIEEVDLLFTDPPFEMYDPAFFAKFDRVCPDHTHSIVMSKFPYTGLVQTMMRRLPLISEYIWHYTDMSCYRASYMPLIHHETISVFSETKDTIYMDRLRQPHRRELPATPQFKTNKSRGKEGKPLYWQQNEKGAWKSSVIKVQRSLKGEMQSKHTTQPIGVKPVEMLLEILPAYGDGIILDPFMGSGSVAIAAAIMGRPYIGIEQNPEFYELAKRRLTEHLNATP